MYYVQIITKKHENGTRILLVFACILLQNNSSVDVKRSLVPALGKKQGCLTYEISESRHPKIRDVREGKTTVSYYYS